MLFPGQSNPLVLMSSRGFDASSAVRLRSSLSSPHDVIKCHAFYPWRSPPLPLDRSSLWQFETSPYRAVSRDPPSSLAQHDALRVFLTQPAHAASECWQSCRARPQGLPQNKVYHSILSVTARKDRIVPLWVLVVGSDIQVFHLL